MVDVRLVGNVNGLRAAETMECDERGKVRRVLAHYVDEA
jgi:hypothetical protein